MVLVESSLDVGPLPLINFFDWLDSRWVLVSFCIFLFLPFGVSCILLVYFGLPFKRPFFLICFFCVFIYKNKSQSDIGLIDLQTENFSIVHGYDGSSFQQHYINQDFGKRYWVFWVLFFDFPFIFYEISWFSIYSFMTSTVFPFQKLTSIDYSATTLNQVSCHTSICFIGSLFPFSYFLKNLLLSICVFS